MKNRSPYLGYAFMAIVVSLICNFSYLLLLVSNQTDTGNQRSNRQRNKDVVIEQFEGRLSVSGDGFGYVVSEQGDSVYIDHRKVHRLGLASGDELLIDASQRSNFEAKHPIMIRIIERNGEEFDYGALYRGSEQWNILLYQFLFYFVLSFILLMVMNSKGFLSSKDRSALLNRTAVLKYLLCDLFNTAPSPTDVSPNYCSEIWRASSMIS